MIVVTYVGSFAISTLGGSPTEVAAPPIFENKHTAIKIRIGLTAEILVKLCEGLHGVKNRLVKLYILMIEMK